MCCSQWRSSVACRPWVLPILLPPPYSYAGQHSITAKIFLWTLLAVEKSKCLLCMLMTEECHCNKWISTGLLTFCKARHAIEAWRMNNITFREIGVKRYQRVRKIPLHERPQNWATDSYKEHILLLNLSPLFCVVLQNGLLMLLKHCHKLDLCMSSRPVICMKLIENRISNLFCRFHAQWEEKQTPLFVLRFPQLLRILQKSHLIGMRHIGSTVE